MGKSTRPGDRWRKRKPKQRILVAVDADKTDLRFQDFQNGITKAVERARELCEAHPPKTYKNPSSGVGYLVDRLTGKPDFTPR